MLSNDTDIVLLLLSLDEVELSPVEIDRMRRVLSDNAQGIQAVRNGLYGAGHRHLAKAVDELVNKYTGVNNEYLRGRPCPYSILKSSDV